MSNKIEIACKGSTKADYRDLNRFQGALKELPEENYQKARKLITELGYSFPICVWVDNKGKKQIINGHQTLNTITRLVETEGYAVDKLPIAEVFAKSLKEAKRKVLAAASQLGRVTPEGLHQFMTENGLDLELLQSDYEFPEIDALHFIASFRQGAEEPHLTLGEGEPDEEGAQGESAPPQSTEHTRQVQFFLTESEFQEFSKYIQTLQEKYGTENITETVFRAVKHAAGN